MGDNSIVEEVVKGSTEMKLTDYIRESLNKVAISEGFTNYELKVDQGSAVGDGFVGVVYKVTIIELASDKSQLEVVVKFPPLNQEKRNNFGAMDLFEREVFVYNKVFPEFVKFQREKNIEETKGFFDFPKCYFAEYNEEKDDSVIIMEDLRETGYKMLDKYEPTDFEHTKAVVKALGRLHAVSFALKAQKPEVFKEFQMMKDFVFEKYNQANLTGLLIESIEKAAETIEETDSESRNKILKLKNDFFQVSKDLIDPELAEPYTVLSQGDYWTNNIMYQYKNDLVHKIKLLDWQNCRYCSPVLDLVNFLFGCANGDLRAKHYDELLKIYHHSLSELLNSLGGNTETQFPFTALQDQFKQFGKYGIVMGSVIIPANSKGDTIIEMEASTDSVELLKKIFTREGVIVKTRVRDAVMDSIRFGYL